MTNSTETTVASEVHSKFFSNGGALRRYMVNNGTFPDHLVVPRNPGLGHWAVDHVMAKTSSIHTYDSMANLKEDKPVPCRNRLASILSKQVAWNCEQVPVRTQKGGWQCGYHLLANSESILRTGKARTVGDPPVDVDSMSRRLIKQNLARR